jgi:hypothetical protein
MGKLALLKAHLGKLSPSVIKQLKRDTLAEKKRRETEASAMAQGLGEQPTGQSGGRQPGCAGKGIAAPQKATRSTVGKRKANALHSSDSGGSLEPVPRRPGHCP